MSKEYKSTDDDNDNNSTMSKTMNKIKNKISKDTKKTDKTDKIEQDETDIKEKIENQNNTSTQIDEKKLSKLAKLSLLLRGPQKEPVSKFSDLKDRAIWTMFMLFGFVGFISAGNFYCAILVFVIMMAIFNELIDLSKYREINQEIKYYYFLNW